MRRVYSYEDDRWEFVENTNHQYVAWVRPPYEIMVKNCTKYDLMIVSQEGSMSWLKLNKGERKKFSSEYWISRFWVNTPHGKFWFDEEGGVITGRELRQGFLRNDVVPIFNDGVIEFRHMPQKWSLQKRSIKPVQNPAYQVKVRNRTPYDIIIWLDNDIIDVVKSKWINTVCLPSGNHMLYFDTKEEEYVFHDKFGNWDAFIGPVNGCQMGIIEDFDHIEPNWQTIMDKRRGFAGWYAVEEIQDFRNRMLFWQCFTGPGSIEPYIAHLYTSYDANKKEIDLAYNTIDYRLD